MDAELRPRHDLAEFFERPEAAGHRDERIRQLRHGRLALVHGAHDAEIGKRAVRELARDERMRDDADGVATGGEHGVGDHTHQADGAPAEDESDAAARHLPAKLRRDIRIDRSPAGARSTEHTDAAKRCRSGCSGRGRQAASLL